MELAFPEGLRVMVVDDDVACLRLVGNMLQRFKYTVTACNQPVDALNLLRDQRDAFDLVITDLRMPGMDGFKLLKHIERELNDVPVIMMSADDERDTVVQCLKNGACFYLVKPVKKAHLMTLWQHVYRKRLWRMREIERTGSIKVERAPELAPYASSVNNKRKEVAREYDEEEEGDNDGDSGDSGDSFMSKKPRVIWTQELHDLFINAVNRIGIDRAVPKKILELMKAPGITRENVASHLQKYRLYLRNVEEAKMCAANGTKPGKRLPGKSIFGPIPSQLFYDNHFCSSHSTNYGSQHVLKSFSRIRYGNQLLNTSTTSHLQSNNFQQQMSFSQSTSGVLLQNNNDAQVRMGFSQFSMQSSDTFHINTNNQQQHQSLPTFANNHFGPCYQKQQSLPSVANNQTFADQGSNYIGLQSVVIGGKLGAIQSGLVGIHAMAPATIEPPKVVGQGEMEVGDFVIPQFDPADFDYDMLDLGALSGLPSEAHLIKTQNDLDSNIGLSKATEETLADVVRGPMAQMNNLLPGQLSDADLADMYFKELEDGSDGSVVEMPPGFDTDGIAIQWDGD